MLSARSLSMTDEGTTISPYALQAIIERDSLCVQSVERRVESISLSVKEIIGRRCYLRGRHLRSQSELKSLFKSIGLKPTAEITSLSIGDLIFEGLHLNGTRHLVQEERSVALETPSGVWTIDRSETERIARLIELKREEDGHRLKDDFERLGSCYSKYPLLVHPMTGDDRFQDQLLTFEDQGFGREGWLRSYRITTLNAESYDREGTYPFIDEELDLELRWSPCFSRWSQLMILLWRGTNHDHVSPFALNESALYPLLAQALHLVEHPIMILVMPETKRSKDRNQRLMVEQKKFSLLSGRPLEELEISRADFEALTHERPPSRELLLLLIDTCNQAMHISQRHLPKLLSPPIEFRITLQQELTLEELPITRELLPSLGLLPREQCKDLPLFIKDTWWLAQAISISSLSDYLGALTSSVLNFLALWGDIPDNRESLCAPLLMNEQQAIITCDLINLCLGLDSLYLNRKDLLDAMKRQRMTSISLKALDINHRGFRLPSLIEREGLHGSLRCRTRETRPEQVWGSTPWELKCWSDLKEWTHDDPYHWALTLPEPNGESQRLCDPFWASILNPGQINDLRDLRAYAWHPESKIHFTKRRSKKRTKGAALRLIFTDDTSRD